MGLVDGNRGDMLVREELTPEGDIERSVVGDEDLRRDRAPGAVLEGAWAEELGCYIVMERSGPVFRRIVLTPDGPFAPSRVAAEVLRYLRGGDYPSEIHLAADRFTDFQRIVFSVVSGIPRSETMTYAEVAEAAGRPGAARAVGGALSRNPYPILIPCHRVVAKNGLGGYRYGLAVKRRLLDLEKATRGSEKGEKRGQTKGEANGG